MALGMAKGDSHVFPSKHFLQILAFFPQDLKFGSVPHNRYRSDVIRFLGAMAVCVLCKFPNFPVWSDFKVNPPPIRTRKIDSS